MRPLHYILPLLFLCMLLPSSQSTAMDSSTGTFSIVAYDSLTGEIGVAVQSKAFGVGRPSPGPRPEWAQ